MAKLISNASSSDGQGASARERGKGLEQSQRTKINKHRCVVCGTPRVCYRGRRFYQTGRSMFGAPFCKEHALHFREYAAPVFENVEAQELFKYMYPQKYRRNVEGKLILYFSTYKAALPKQDNLYCGRQVGIKLRFSISKQLPFFGVV